MASFPSENSGNGPCKSLWSCAAVSHAAVWLQAPPRTWDAPAPAPAQHGPVAPHSSFPLLNEPSQQQQQPGHEVERPGAAMEPLVTVGSGRVGSGRGSGRGVVLAEVQPQRTLLGAAV